MHQLRIWENYTVARLTPRDFAIDQPHNQEVFTHPAHAKVHRRQVIYLIIFCLCLSAAAATFTLVVLESSQVGSTSITSSGFRAALQAIFSVPLITDACVTAVIIFWLFLVWITDSQSAPQARWDTYRGAIMDVIEGYVVFPVFLLKIINACSHYYGNQNALDCITQVATIVLLLAWIAAWLSGDQHAEAESVNQESTAVQSRSNHHHVGAGEVNYREFLEEPPDTSGPFTCSDAIEMAIPTLVVD